MDLEQLRQILDLVKQHDGERLLPDALDERTRLPSPVAEQPRGFVIQVVARRDDGKSPVDRQPIEVVTFERAARRTGAPR